MQPISPFYYLWYIYTKHMKKIVFILAICLTGTLAANAFNTLTPVVKSADQVIYCKILNDLSGPFEYKVGADIFTVEVGRSGALAYEENTQILKKDTHGNWVNWFVFTSIHANQTIKISTLLAN
jgi:hypothetical protein